MRTWFLILLAALIASAAGEAGAERLAIVVSDQVNVSQDDAYGWADELGKVLSREVKVIPSQDVRPILAAENPAPTCYLDPGCLRELGNKLGADELMVLHVVKIAGQVQIDSTWYELGAGRSSARGSLSFSDNPAARAEALGKQGGSLRPGGVAPREEEINLGLWISAGATGALLAGAITFTLVAFKADGDAADCAALGTLPDEVCPNISGDERLDQIRDRRDSRALTADILWIGTGIAAASTVLFAIYGGSDSEPEKSRVTFAPTEGGAAVSWTLRF
ncbi:MAG: hypothetical protein KJO07_05680 [Deltaproteobacteria bacterium]|nr:hypothetical protein [Deltaproteobacteria bacterium]